MPWPQTDATQYHAQLGLPDKGRVIKGMIVCNNWDLEPLDLLNDLALGCCQMSHDLLIVLILHFFIRWTIYIYVYKYNFTMGII